MRKTILILSAAVLAAGGAARAAVEAQPIPAEFLQQFGPLAVQVMQAQFPNPPVKVDPRVEKIVGSHVQESLGVVLVPDKNLAPKVIEEAGDKDVPVAVLVAKSLNLQMADGPVSKDRLAIAEVTDQVKLPVFFLAARGNAAERTLLVYGKDGKPITTLPLKKATGDLSAPVALKLTDIDPEKKTLNATISLNGSYETTVKMAYADF